MNKPRGCPIHATTVTGNGSTRAIADLTNQLKDGVLTKNDTPEMTQAIYAYRIFQLGNSIEEVRRYMNEIGEEFESEEMTYAKASEEIKVHFINICTRILSVNEPNAEIIGRLRDGLNTFHAYMKRVVIISNGRNDSIDYKNMIQFASTSIERLNVLALDPYHGWEGLFFDANIDVSQLLKGMPINRPIYRCPILYSGRMRVLAEYYYEVLAHVWKQSVDKPTELEYFT